MISSFSAGLIHGGLLAAKEMIKADSIIPSAVSSALLIGSGSGFLWPAEAARGGNGAAGWLGGSCCILELHKRQSCLLPRSLAKKVADVQPPAGGLLDPTPVLGGLMHPSGSSPDASCLLALVVPRRKGESEQRALMVSVVLPGDRRRAVAETLEGLIAFHSLALGRFM